MKPLRTTASIVLVCAAPFLGGSLLYLGALGLTEARAARRRVVVPSASASLWDALTQSFASAPTLAVGRTHPAGALLPDGSVLIAGGAALLAGALDTVPAFTSEVVRVGHPSSGTAALVQNAERCIALALPDGRAMLIADGEAPSITRANGSWERGAPYLQRPGQWGTFASALLPDGRVLLVLPAQGRAETWDPATATWKEAARPALGVDQPELLALEDGRMLLVGATEADTRLQVWTPGASSWQPVGERSGRAVSHRAVQLRGGEVLVLREVLNDWRGTVRDAALWDPGTGRLSTVDSPAASVQGSTLTALPDGLALHVGEPLPEIWSSREKKWTPVPAPPSPLRNHVAVRLDDARVLLAGGDGPSVSRVDASHVWTSAAAGLGILALLGGGFAAARVSRVSPVVVAMALAVAGLTAALLHALASIPFGGG